MFLSFALPLSVIKWITFSEGLFAFVALDYFMKEDAFLWVEPSADHAAHHSGLTADCLPLLETIMPSERPLGIPEELQKKRGLRGGREGRKESQRRLPDKLLENILIFNSSWMAEVRLAVIYSSCPRREDDVP